MNELIFFLNKGIIGGAVIGSIYALGAIGVTLVFSILRFAHFAHGDMMTLGAFVAYALTLAVPTLGLALGLPTAFVLLPLAVGLTALAAILIDKAVYAPLRERGAKTITLVMASIGVTLMLQALIRIFAGTGTQSLYVAERKDVFRLQPPEWLASSRIVITEPQILLFAVTALAVVGLHVFLTRSRLGKAMRAVSDNPDLARVSGVSVPAVVTATWAIAGGLAATAGVMLALDVSLKADLSFLILLPIFAAAIVGGVGSPYGAVAGGFIIGYAETLAVFNWAVLLRPIERALDWDFAPAALAIAPTEYKITVPFVILLIVLVVRPTGVFRGKVL